MILNPISNIRCIQKKKKRATRKRHSSNQTGTEMEMEDISARQDMNLAVSMKRLIREVHIIESIKRTAVANARIAHSNLNVRKPREIER